jgi:hypothetical protein
MFQTPRRVEPRREPPTFAATRLVMILAALPCEERPLRAQVVFKSTQEDNQMKRIILASACIMALATGGAFAQTQPAPGASGQAASGQGDVGPSSRGPATKGMTTGTSSNMQNEAADSKGKQTPSTGGSNTNNMGSQAGGGAGSGK